MTDVVAALRQVPLFADLEDDDLVRLGEAVARRSLARGEVLFDEGEEGDDAFVIEEGELEVLKMSGTREVLLACRFPGEVIGEMALLDRAPRMATVRAARDARLIVIPRASLEELINTSADATRALFGVLLSRVRQTEAQLRQSERMAQIGTLTAGLAHELNNPAAAVQRAARRMREALAEQAATTADLLATGVDPGDPRVTALLAPGEPELVSALERSDREGEIEARLAKLDVVEPWTVAAELVGAGLTAADVDRVVEEFEPGPAAAVLRAAAAGAAAFSLAFEIEEGTKRMSAIVGALKSYSYLDQAPVQEIDLHRGLDDTLLIMRSKLEGITVERDYAADLPRVTAYAGELNQVWTNLIDNAADALAEAGGGTLTVHTRRDGDMVVVEIEDDGPGIPPEVKPRIFDAFFTTKPPGSGTGLGLDITYGIVVHKHRGSIDFESHPGRTVFRVELPIEQPA